MKLILSALLTRHVRQAHAVRPRRYIQLVEAYRDEDGRARQRTAASLGRLESIDQHFESVIRGLERVTGRQRLPSDAA